MSWVSRTAPDGSVQRFFINDGVSDHNSRDEVYSPYIAKDEIQKTKVEKDFPNYYNSLERDTEAAEADAHKAFQIFYEAGFLKKDALDRMHKLITLFKSYMMKILKELERDIARKAPLTEAEGFKLWDDLHITSQRLPLFDDEVEQHQEALSLVSPELVPHLQEARKGIMEAFERIDEVAKEFGDLFESSNVRKLFREQRAVEA